MPGLAHDNPAVRADTANVLGRLRVEAAQAALEKALVDPAPVVRIEAALAMGEMARAVRAEKRKTLELHEQLADAVGDATSLDETKALLWAAAQLDTQEGYDIVREARKSEDAAVRRFAERTLENPRRRLVLN